MEEPRLEDILALGGTEDDLELLRGEKGGKETDLPNDEVENFIREIGLGDDCFPTQPALSSVSKRRDKTKRSALNKTDNKSSVAQPGPNRTDKKQSTTSIVSSSDPPPVDLTELSQMGVIELYAASHQLEDKLMKLSIEEHKKVLVTMETEVPWYEEAHSGLGTIPVSQPVLNHLYVLAGQVLACEMKLYLKLREMKRGKDVQWLKTVLAKGTLSDKIAAMTLLIQESTVHSLSTIDFFISMSKKRSKRENLVAIDHFKDLLVSDVLPEKRKLKYLKQRPLEKLLLDKGHGSASCDLKVLFLWYFEDQLKNKFCTFVNLLKDLLHDPVAEIREKITGVVFDLLYNRPEQEQLLLKLLINKLGDPNRKLASKCILFLLKLLNRHVNMKLVVVREIETLLHRPNISPKTEYYSVCFLNQIVIGPSDQLLPQKLVNLYFSFFKLYIERREFDSKILSALLTGVNRALPFLKAEIPSFEDHLTSLFKIVHMGPLATAVQSLALLYQVMEGRQAVSSRYYRALYQKLSDVELGTRTGQQAMFLNLLFKSLRSDPELDRNKAFFKRILQSCDYHMPHFVCGCLLIISEILKIKPVLWSFILQPEATEEEEIFKDVQESDEDNETLHSEQDKFEDVQENEERESTPEEDLAPTEENRASDGYILTSRDPLYCRAEITCLWELSRVQ